LASPGRQGKSNIREDEGICQTGRRKFGAIINNRRKTMIKNFIFEDDGMEMVEWALVAVLFAVVAGVAFTGVGTAVATALGSVASSINP
jgi:Flp pilus assembly pilin Flp